MPIRHVAIVSIPDRTAAELRERGVELSPIESAPWGRFAMFRDPDGNGFVLPQAAQ